MKAGDQRATIKLQRFRGAGLFLLSFVLLQLAQAAPPLNFPSDGHRLNELLATGSIISINKSNPGPNPAVAQLFQGVAQFHAKVNELSQDPAVDPARLGQTCLTCHSDVFDRQTLLRKMPSQDGTIVVDEEKNHHQVHKKKQIVDFGTQCTFCHNEFVVSQTENQIVIASYVEKTTCANCHSRFTPRSLMDPTWRDLFGCPGCHQDTVPATHQSVEFSRRFVKDEFITPVDCFSCHGDNPMQLPLWLQDQYWQNVNIEFDQP